MNIQKIKNIVIYVQNFVFINYLTYLLIALKINIFKTVFGGLLSNITFVNKYI